MHYYASVPMHRPDLVLDNRFWLDLAKHILEKKSFEGFLSGTFFYSCSNISEIIFSCAFLGLPFSNSSHEIKPTEDKGLKLKFQCDSMLFLKEIKRAEAKIGTNMHAIHRYFIAGQEHNDTPINNFTTHQVYGCEVIVTNVSSKKINYQLLWQIPQGSLPLQNINYQKSENSNLEPYSTRAFKYYFYFPSEGLFTHFPSNVSVRDTVIAVSNTQKLKVTIDPDQDGPGSLSTATLEVLLEFLKTSNLFKENTGFTFEMLFWRLKERSVYDQILEVFRNRRIFHIDVWKFAFYHKDPQGVKGKPVKNLNLKYRVHFKITRFMRNTWKWL